MKAIHCSRVSCRYHAPVGSCSSGARGWTLTWAMIESVYGCEV